MFKKAERKRIFVKMALCGVSGSGKTYSALLLAQGLGGKIAMIDTENGSGELYSDLCEYDAAQLEPPFSPMKFINAIKEAEAEGYNVLIIDSLSHAWSGQGGILEMVDKKSATSRSGNSFTAWRDVTPEHNKLVDAILQCRMHVIVCMRSKTAYEMQENEKGKKTPVKVGLAPIQRDGMEYEFTIVFDIDREKHYALASKDRTGLFEKTIDVITPATGELIRKWVEGGVEVSVEVEAVKRPIRADKFVQVYSDDCMVLTKKGFESIKNLPVDTLAQMAAHQNYALAATAITDFLDAKAVAMTVDGSAEATEIDALVNELPDIEDQASKVDGPIG
ncbi:ATP-binding protein [Phascolarctobacterium faecium]|uniref:ATP-binding protein n=1 Tax=Phascolarctobacterium faecium TaxID=33025 RepID=UPI002E8E3CC8|nr:ATP-binding protein [Phascolarctobacterium faecium]